MTMSKLSSSFISRADEAAFWEAWVAAILARAGFSVTHLPFAIAEDGEADPEKGVSYDLSVANPAGTDKHLEVKGRNLTFYESPESFPFPTVNVCSANYAKRNWPDTFPRLGRDFLIVSQRTGHILWIPEGNLAEVCTVEDKTRGEKFQCVVAPKGCLMTFAAFVQALNSKVKR